MRLDKFTVKAQEALQAAQSLADQHGQQAIAPEREREPELPKLPSVRGGEPYLAERTRAALERAQTEAGRLKDEYVSTEHLLLALAQDRESPVARLLGQHGVTAEAVYRALVEVRGPQRVTRPNPADKYQAPH